MSSIISSLKNAFSNFIKSAPEIFKGFVIFALTFSGLGCALLLRYLSFNGYIITTLSLLIEAIGLIACYLLFKSYFKPEQKSTPTSEKKKSKED